MGAGGGRAGLAAAVVWAMAGCGSGGGSVPLPDADGAGHAETHDGSADQAPETGWPDSVTEAGGDIFDDCQPGEGCFGEPCNDNSDCQSKLCVHHLGEKVCSRFCIEECPAGWSCQEILLGGTDTLFACVSDFPFLCTPCQADDDCSADWGGHEVCVSYGDSGAYCGGSCSPDKFCPPGYACESTTSVLGLVSDQCKESSGSCGCTAAAIAAGLSTACANTNDWGSCQGFRFCEKEGLTECKADWPAQEECNGKDDDCDGDVDEAPCDDGNPCTQDSCEGEAGCAYEPLDSEPCDDGDACTGSDFCQQGECGGLATSCDDGNPCTDDGCIPATGCESTDNTAACDDGDPCSVGDKCLAAKCSGVPVACDCTTDADCKGLEDGNACNGSLLCDTSKVPFQCRVDIGSVVVCPAPEGLDGICQKAVCDPTDGSCSQEPAKEGMACTDGNACTLGDKCVAGSCTGQVPLSCDDSNVCTLDECDPLSGCKHAPAPAECDDGNPCTVADFCEAGTCKGAAPADCDDGNLCTTDSCDPALGCGHVANAVPCDDGDACTAGDLCAQGSCQPGAPIDCDDANVCTADSCDAAAGCLKAPVPGECDDDNTCTLGDHCADGKCTPENVIQCDDMNVCTDDVCDLAQGCKHVDNQAPCDDDDACTKGDVCNDGACESGAPLACNDGNVCTDDSCHKVTGCVFKPNLDLCDDNNKCTTADTCSKGQCVGTASIDCNDDNVCTTDTCQPGAGCVHSLNAAPCDDGNPCTIGDHCQLGACTSAQPLVCADGNVCTDDACNPQVGCEFLPNAGQCDDGNVCTAQDTCSGGWCIGKAVADCDDGNPCTTDGCQPGSGCWHAANTMPCDDGDKCTVGDLCADTVCQSGTGKLKCDDGNVCTADSCAADAGCLFAPVVPCCSNGVVEEGELCDDGNLAGGDGCSADCKSDETCGNGILDPGSEECDGKLFPFKCHKGSFACTPECKLETAGCSSWCGDAALDKSFEACDGDLFPTTCYDGVFACLYGCKVWDKSGCTGWCGDGEVNGGEECDGFDFAFPCPLAECYCSADCSFNYDVQEGAVEWAAGDKDGTSNQPANSPDPDCLDPKNLCLDSTTKSLKHIWIANSNDHEVVRINVDTGAVEKEVSSWGENPSRTAVVTKDSSVWVGNRSWSNYNDPAKSNVVHLDVDGKLICRGDLTGMVRAVGIDKDGNVWAGSYHQHKLFKFSGTEVDENQSPPRCKKLAEVGIPACPYGAIGDGKGNLWVAGNCNWASYFDITIESVSRIDVATNTVVGTYNAPPSVAGCFAVYGITVDGQGRVIIGTHADNCRGLFRFTPETNSWEWISSAFVGSTRGVVVDQDGYIYAAISHAGGDMRHVVRVTPDFKNISALDLGGGMAHPVGAAIDRNGKLWTAGRNSGSCARIDVKKWGNSPKVDIFPTNGSDPYTYSDMTGFQHLMFTNPEGTWRQQFDGGADKINWKTVEWTGKEEAGITDIKVRARSAATEAGLAMAGWTSYFTASPAHIDGLPTYRWLEVEVKLTSTDPNKTPVVHSLSVHWAK
jgi:cysteine-rich repeat protein